MKTLSKQFTIISIILALIIPSSSKVYTSTSEYLKDNDTIGYRKFIKDSIGLAWQNTNDSICPKFIEQMAKASEMDTISDSSLFLSNAIIDSFYARKCDISKYYPGNSTSIERNFGKVCIKDKSTKGIKLFLSFLQTNCYWTDEDQGQSCLVEMLKKRPDDLVPCIFQMPNSTQHNIFVLYWSEFVTENVYVYNKNKQYLDQLKAKYPILYRNIINPK